MIRQHVELCGDNPLDALVAGTHHKAYLVSYLGLAAGPHEAADHYAIGVADVYGAIAFRQRGRHPGVAIQAAMGNPSSRRCAGVSRLTDPPPPPATPSLLG